MSTPDETTPAPKTVLKPLPPLLPQEVSAQPNPQTLEEREAEQVKRAMSSPLSIGFQIIGCSLANAVPQEGTEIPKYEFNLPCIRGYANPCQECRSCVNVRLIPVGTLRGVSTHRYHGHGMVVPVSEELANKVTDLLTEADALPLTNPAWEDRFTEQKQASQAQQQAEAQAHELERRQLGPHGTLPR